MKIWDTIVSWFVDEFEVEIWYGTHMGTLSSRRKFIMKKILKINANTLVGIDVDGQQIQYVSSTKFNYKITKVK